MGELVEKSGKHVESSLVAFEFAMPRHRRSVVFFCVSLYSPPRSYLNAPSAPTAKVAAAVGAVVHNSHMHNLLCV